MNNVALTTFDNPYDPFDDFTSWFLFDVQKGYNSCAYLARIAKISDELSEKEIDEEIEKAISMAQKYIEKEKKKRTRLKERAYCFLATRGFDTDIISSAMNSLDFSEEE